MKRVWLLTRFFLALACAFTVAEGQDFSRALDESDPVFAKRVLRISKDADLHTMSSTWNGFSTLFVDYETIGEYPERLLVALQHQPAGEYREIQVTVGEQEGGTPDIIEDVRSLEPDSKTIPSNTITGILEDHLGSILIQNAYLEMPGGATSIPPSPPEKDGAYPQSNEFGQVPAYAFYVRHANGITFDHVVIKAIKPDVRPWLVTEDASVTTHFCTNLNHP